MNLAEASTLIATCGAYNTIILEGEPGIGKSALLDSIGAALGIPKENRIYFDAQRFDMGDFAIPVPDLKAKVLNFMVNSMFIADNNHPLLIMADEIGKASKAVRNIVMTMMHEYRIGDYHLPEGTIIFGTTNLSSDGVGDVMEAHFRNRVSVVEISKPNAEEWLVWAGNNDVEPEIMAWVHEYQHCLISYTDVQDSQDVNPYIFDPRRTQDAFVSPRSLHKASNIVKNRASLSANTLTCALAGTVGASAAGDMAAYFDLADTLPPIDAILAKPDTIKVPDNPIANCILALSLVARISSKTVTAIMTFVRRMPLEVQFMFAKHGVGNAKASQVLIRTKAFTSWARENSYLV